MTRNVGRLARGAERAVGAGMRSLPLTLVLAFALLVAVTTSALADGTDATPAPTARKQTDRSHLGLTVGLATPTGELGAEYTLVVMPNLEIGFGVGLADMIPLGGESLSPDPQAAIMPRFRYALGPTVLTAGVGLSGGRYTTYLSPFASTPGHAIDEVTNALWANGEAGVEYHLHGMFARAYLGAGKVIAHSEIKHYDGGTNMNLVDDALPYVGLTVGHTF